MPEWQIAIVIVAVVGHAAAGAAQGKGGADDCGQADVFERFQGDAATPAARSLFAVGVDLGL